MHTMDTVYSVITKKDTKLCSVFWVKALMYSSKSKEHSGVTSLHNLARSKVFLSLTSSEQFTSKSFLTDYND